MLSLWGVLLVYSLTTAAGLDRQIDLLEGLQLHNTSHQGVSLAPGPHSLTPAIYLNGDYRDLKLSQGVYKRVVELLQHNTEFTLATSLRQEETNSGSIVSFSHGYNRYLELQSSGRKDEIRLHYTHNNAVQVEIFPYRLADNSWHKVALSVSGAQVELLVDCHKLYRRVLRELDRNFTVHQGELALWLGQRNNKHSLFKGALQDVRLVAGPHGYLNQCPHLDTTCPTCGQFSLLQSTVEQLQRHLHELTQRLVVAEARIGRVEECDCQKSCRINGSVHADGATWQKGCDICACVRGQIQCRPVQCPEVSCKNPVYTPGECCPSCLKQCYLRGVLYDHGESVNLRQCVECECHDGSMHCKRIDPETMCPSLPCSTQDQFSVPGECCKFCPGVDYCAKGHMCHANATCLNLQTTYACQCNVGYFGDGHTCHDIDECKEEGGLEGHHCHSNTRCVNTPGSYVCECLPGYKQLDKFNCVEHDECDSGDHRCHENALCINTLGSYHCECLPGYQGDGYTCEPICNQTCLNGGECLAPGQCSCRKGYVGPSCEFDLDECALGLHKCHPNSTCVNMLGWYYCQCKAGYRSIHHDNSLGAMCQDTDECAEGNHTCHKSADCVNIDGGYKCSCSENSKDCSLNCVYQAVEIANRASFSPEGSPCKHCTCNDGIVTCEDPKCDCSERGVNLKCCPHCDTSSVCRHQELHHVMFKNGERWIYQCQTCECLFGEIDCWPMECPPLMCNDPILSPGDCCPRCENDPCSADDNSTTVTEGQPCTYLGRLYASGTDWQDSYDKCTTCKCKDGSLCCSYSFECASVSSKFNNSGSSGVLDEHPLDEHETSINITCANHSCAQEFMVSDARHVPDNTTSQTLDNEDIKMGEGPSMQGHQQQISKIDKKVQNNDTVITETIDSAVLGKDHMRSINSTIHISRKLSKTENNSDLLNVYKNSSFSAKNIASNQTELYPQSTMVSGNSSMHSSSSKVTNKRQAIEEDKYLIQRKGNESVKATEAESRGENFSQK